MTPPLDPLRERKEDPVPIASEDNTVLSSLTTQRRYYLLKDAYGDLMLDGVQPTGDVFHSLIVGTMQGARLQDTFFFRNEMRTMVLIPDILEEMKIYDMKPNGQTYAIVRDMTAAAAGLNKFCYTGLITTHKNRTPLADDTAAKIIELVEQSKGRSSVEALKIAAANVMVGVSSEELYNLPTAEYIHRRGRFISRQLTVYHVALHACADIRNIETLIEGAMIGYTPRGMQLAQETLVQINSRNFFLNTKKGNDLLLATSGEKVVGAYYYKGLKDREIPEDDPRLFSVSKISNDLNSRFSGPGKTFARIPGGI